MIFIWVRCGFRIGEMLALKWKNLDYFNKTLYVESTLHANASEGLPKNEYSQRHVPLRTEVIDAFKRQAKRARMACEYIFPDPYTNARYATPALFYKRFIFLLALASLKPRSPNQLRHTFATLHIASGENITWVSRMLGHSNTKITLDKYNQYVPNLLHEDGSAFEKAVQKPSLERQNSDTMATPPE
jgi:integrase